MSFLSTFYNVLTAPGQEFSRIANTNPEERGNFLVQSVVIILVLSGFTAVYSPVNQSTGALWLNVIFASVSGLIYWVIAGSIFASAAYIFGTRARLQPLLILTAYAALPWLFMPVLMLFKGTLAGFGNVIALFGLLGVWLWAVILYLMAFKYTYRLSLDRVLLVAFLPFLMMFIGASWFSGFFYHLIQFLSP